MLKEALTQVESWEKAIGHQMNVAVNLSPCQFRDPGLVDHIERMLEQFGLTCQNLNLEITEGVLMSGHSHIDDALRRLNQLGISIAMDDFGTGYSSLNYLRSYPFHVLKIDRSFVSDIAADESDRQLITATCNMAQGLNMKVIAEGIETQQQLDFLKEQGCNYGQGNLFSKPISASDMGKFMAEHAFTNLAEKIKLQRTAS